ncbi:hypothetical protein RST01_21390 [Rummeliibacillus stabekisii]|nr:hypothetical protein RST01_21390 [Rummeliibacillus stabekisii]
MLILLLSGEIKFSNPHIISYIIIVISLLVILINKTLDVEKRESISPFKNMIIGVIIAFIIFYVEKVIYANII